MSQKQKFAIKAGEIFLVVLIVFTFLSKTIDNMLIPKVDTTTITKGAIGETIYAQGSVKINTEKISLPYDCVITDSQAKGGKRLEKGEVLCSFESEDMEVGELEQQLSLTAAENRVKDLERQIREAGGSTADNSTTLANLQEQLSVARMKYEKMQNEFPYNGKVVSELKGVVRTLNYKEGDTVPGGAVLVETGEVDYFGYISESTVKKVMAPFELKVTKIHIRQGGQVGVGNVILEFSAPDIDIALQEQENAINQLERSIRDLNKAPTPSNTAGLYSQLEEARLQLQIEQERQALVKSDVDGNSIMMPFSGEVMRAVTGEVSANQTIFELYDPEEPFDVEFQVTEQNASQLVPGESKVTLTLRGKKLDGSGTGSVDETYTLESMSYNEQTGKYDCKVTCDKSKVQMRSGASVSVSAGAARTSYDMVLPRACVFKDGEERAYIYTIREEAGLFGSKYYLDQKEVTILEEDSLNYAVSLSESLPDKTPVVAYTKVTLQDGMRVKY